MCESGVFNRARISKSETNQIPRRQTRNLGWSRYGQDIDQFGFLRISNVSGYIMANTVHETVPVFQLRRFCRRCWSLAPPWLSRPTTRCGPAIGLPNRCCSTATAAPLQELRTDRTVRRLAWVPLEAVSPALLSAVVRAEDKRFYEHAGVDWRALAAAALRGVPGGPSGGPAPSPCSWRPCSTRRSGPGRGGRSLGQKWRQMQAARELDDRWRKDEILEAYLNLVFFRGEYQGVGAAAAGCSARPRTASTPPSRWCWRR